MADNGDLTQLEEGSQFLDTSVFNGEQPKEL